MHALNHEVDLDVVTTERQGHAYDLAAQARDERFDVVITLGGDGTINETVNGLMSDQAPGTELPMLACVPGGSANVFARSLGIANDPVEATGQIIDALHDNQFRTVSVGAAQYTLDGIEQQRYFVINGGVGLDAEIVASMEAQRSSGKVASPTRYLMTTLREFFVATDRREPALSLSRVGAGSVEGIYMAIVQNTSPWTYLGPLPVNPCPGASYETGLDVFALRNMSLPAALRYSSRMLRASRAAGTDSLLRLHDVSQFTINANRPSALQLDGDGIGDITRVTFTNHPRALRVVTDQSL